MPTRRRASETAPEELAPVLRPVFEPVVEHLDRLETTVLQMRDALEVQFKRTAAIQAQLDRLVAELTKRRR